MQDNDLIRVFYPIIKAGLVAVGYNDVVVKQSQQPTQQGANTAPTVYFFKIGDKRYGFLRRSDDTTIDADNHTETQQYETTFQVMAWVRQRPGTPYQYTASDLVNEVAAIMQSDSTRATLLASGVQILRVTTVSNPYFGDDRNQFEASPSFEFVLTHTQTRVTTVPVINSTDVDIDHV